MRRNGKVVRNVDFTCFQISALTIFLLLSVIFVSGCQKEKEQITRRPPPTPTFTPCTAVDPLAFTNQAAVTPLGRREVCVPVGECVAANTDTRDKMARTYCVRNHRATCRTGFCSSRSCKPVFDSATSTGVDIAGCAAGAVGLPGCAVGEQLCKCDLSIAPMGVLDCDCGCR